MSRRAPHFPTLSTLLTLAYISPSYARPSSTFGEQPTWGFGKGLTPLNMTTLIVDLVLGLIFLSQAYKLLKLLIPRISTPTGRLLLPSIIIFLFSAISIIAHFGIHAAWVAIARTNFIGPGVPVLTAGFLTWLNHTMYVGDVLIVAGFLYLCVYRAAVINGAAQTQSFAMNDVAGESQVHLQAPRFTSATGSTSSQDLHQAASPTPSTVHPRLTTPTIVKATLDTVLVLGSIVPLAFMAKAISILSDPNTVDSLSTTSRGTVILLPRLEAAARMFIDSSRAYIGIFAALSIHLVISSLLVKNAADKRGLSDITARTLTNVVSPLLLIWTDRKSVV